jgi:hypothetical protein
MGHQIQYQLKVRNYLSTKGKIVQENGIYQLYHLMSGRKDKEEPIFISMRIQKSYLLFLDLSISLKIIFLKAYHPHFQKFYMKYQDLIIIKITKPIT